MTQYVIAGNWKMNAGPSEAISLAKNLKKMNPEIAFGVDVVICPPLVSLSDALDQLSDSDIQLGAQNMHWKNSGAYTGEIAPSMLVEAGCTHVIIGHSERREYFGETDGQVNLKTKAALAHDLIPIVCVGETLQQRKAGEHIELVSDQIQKAFDGISDTDVPDVLVAYEPVWAIGTGETATPEQAQEMHQQIRRVITNLYTPETANTVRILYGGSMKPENAAELLAQPDVNGGLIGGASLKAESFTAIIREAEKNL